MANDVVVKDATKQDSAATPLYTNASAVLNELPVTLVEKITVMAKKKFADQILAGHALTSICASSGRITCLT